MALDGFLVYICCTVMSCVLQSIFNNNFNFLVFIYTFTYLGRNVVFVVALVQVLSVKCQIVVECTTTPVQWLQEPIR